MERKRKQDPSADDLHQDPEPGAAAAGSSAGDQQPGRPGSGSQVPEISQEQRKERGLNNESVFIGRRKQG